MSSILSLNLKADEKNIHIYIENLLSIKKYKILFFYTNLKFEKRIIVTKFFLVAVLR